MFGISFFILLQFLYAAATCHSKKLKILTVFWNIKSLCVSKAKHRGQTNSLKNSFQF